MKKAKALSRGVRVRALRAMQIGQEKLRDDPPPNEEA